MKKKLSLCFLATLFVIKTISAQGYYTGKYYDYGPYYAYADYIGTTATTSAYAHYNELLQSEKKAGSPITILEKLSKQDSTLLWGALGAFDYEPGEIYFVMIQPSRLRSGRHVWLFVEIEKDNSCSWYGYECYIWL